MPILNEKKLRKVCFEIFKGLGASDEEAERVTSHLVTNNLLGHDSHGVIRIPSYASQIREGTVKLDAKLEIIRETPSTAVLNGNWGPGPVIAKKAMDIAIEKAGNHSVACVAVRNSGHIGRLGEYSTMAAERDFIGVISSSNRWGARPMAPYGGIARRLSNNPLSIAFPSGEEKPVLLDMACSVAAEGKLRVKRNRGDRIPEGWIIDSEGRPSTDPNDFYRGGSILPLGGMSVGHKGFCLAFVLEVLGGLMSGAFLADEADRRTGNAFFIRVIKIADFLPVNQFREGVDQFIRYMKSSPVGPGFKEILIPGELEFREERKRRREGIPIDEETWRQITETAEEVGLKLSVS